MIDVEVSAGVILLVVGACALLEDSVGLGVILPTETVLVGAGAAASARAVSVWAVLVVAWVCGICGDYVGYRIGRHFGPRLLQQIGRFLRLTPERTSEVDELLRRWGLFGIAIGRFVPGVRTIVMPSAGIVRMPTARFLAGDALGVGGWAALHIAIGYLVGFSVGGGSHLAVLGPVMIVLLVAISLYALHRRRRSRSDV